jgi:type II secretory pathway component GspD/PulD (secretin)/tetratricopeptide (TPR) repeat protein
VFHASKWGWKRLAANLLLIPVLTGGSAAVAHAQLKTGSAQSSPAPATRTTTARTPGAAMPTTGDPKQLLKEGRKALAAGQFDRAQDLARAAEANNPSGKWGLFDDTPNALLKDIQAAVVKSQKEQSKQLVAQAKALFAKPAANEAERAANLDQALQLAQRADQLHGPYSAWDFGDRADKLYKEIQTARSRIRTVPITTATTLPSGGNGSGQPSSALQPASGTTPAATSTAIKPPPGANDNRKATAIKLMTEGKKLADQGNFAAARAKYIEADRLGVQFDSREYTPGFALQELNARGQGAIDKLLAEARSQMGKKDYPRAEAALNAASEIAGALGLFPRPVEEAKAQLRMASGGKFGATATPGIVAIGNDTLVPVDAGTQPVNPTSSTGPVMPAFPPGMATVGGPIAPAQPPTPPTGTATGRQLLDQARIEFSKGDFEMAEKLAQQAHNLGGVQEEARGLLNTIDAERLKLKTMSAERSFAAAKSAFENRDYNHALNVLLLIDPNLLSAEDKIKRSELLTACKAELDKGSTPVATTGGMQSTLPGLPMGGSTEQPLAPGLTPPGSAQVGTNPQSPGGADNLNNQVQALKQVQVQKLRSEGLKIQADAQAAFGRGETDLAIQMLVDYSNRVSASGLEPSSIAMLLRPIDSRLEMFRVMKAQMDGIARVTNEARDARAMITGRGAAEEQRKAELTALVRKYHDLVKQSKYAEAEKVAMQAKQLDPDDPAISALAHMAKINKRVKEQEQLKDAKERLVYQGLTDAEQPGPLVSVDDPVYVKLEAMRRAQRRGSLDNAFIRTRTPAEFEIELKLDKPISIEFNQTPLDQAVENIKELTKLPLVIDYATLDAEGISAVKPVTVKPGSAVSTRNILSFTLEQAGLSYVIENELVKVTSTRKAKGRLYTKVFSVADLVTPIPNFALPDYANFEKMLNKSALNSGNVHIQGLTGGGPTPVNPVGGLGGGTQASLPAATTQGLTPGISGGLPFGPGGRLETNQWTTPNPLGASASLAGERNTKHEQLIKLITGMVKPYSWDGMGGPGRIEYYDIGSALVVNQVADVIQEVADLLEALRRLQDLAIAVELRIVSLSETWYERMGVDFSMNIKTHTSQFEPALTTGTFRPVPYINDINVKGVTVGLTPAGTFTGDLDVPIRPNNFNRAIPPFGGYPNTPGDNGGVALGLAFLNDIQVYMFMEAAQGDRRVNVMQAPKLTLFNGQTSTMTVADTQFFVTSVTVVSVNGQLVFIPNNTPLPGTPDTNFAITIQGVVSADRRFVRLNLPVTMAAQSGAVVPLFPITTFVTPVFEGGSQGQPIPFTQFLQQPSFTTLNINTTVVCPDGGTVLLGGLKTLSEGRNEFGPPFLSKIPYLNRLFKNVGIGRETRHIMIMVTPRIIINSEEEIFQTEGRPPTIQP